jgi:hypothetical protein
LLFPPSVSADKIILKSGETVKGYILADYDDRVVISTYGGMREIQKESLYSAVYDSEVRALIKIADNQEKRRQYVKAYYTYSKVLELDPDMQLARDRMLFLHKFIRKKLKSDLNGIIKKRNSGSHDASPAASEELYRKMGIKLENSGKHAFVAEMEDASVLRCQDIFLREGDRIISVWGKLTAYMDLEEISSMLLLPGEVKLTLERSVPVFIPEQRNVLSGFLRDEIAEALGADIRLDRYGFMLYDLGRNSVLKQAGIDKGDYLSFFDGKDLKFVPFDKLNQMVRDNRGQQVDLTVRKTVTFWKKEPEL